MNLLNFFNRRSSAPQARERLQILLSHERASTGGQPDLLAKLREEILEVIGRHVTVDKDKVMVKLDRGDQVSMLEVDIEIPNQAELRKLAG